MSKFANILITGASSGIGAALAIHYAENGAENLFICGRNQKRLNAVADKCRKAGAKVFPKIIDVAGREAMAEWIAECEEQKPLQLVFANAGVATLQETADSIHNTFDINVGGVVNTVIPVIEQFQKKRRKNSPRAIAITASIAGYHGLCTCPSYSASKACVKAWGEALRLALKPEGIQVSVICPGFIRSRITDKNTCPMPLFMEAEAAAVIIATQVEQNVGLIAFPWQLRLAAWLVSILPARWGEVIYSLLPNKV